MNDRRRVRLGRPFRDGFDGGGRRGLARGTHLVHEQLGAAQRVFHHLRFDGPIALRVGRGPRAPKGLGNALGDGARPHRKALAAGIAEPHVDFRGHRPRGQWPDAERRLERLVAGGQGFVADPQRRRRNVRVDDDAQLAGIDDEQFRVLVLAQDAAGDGDAQRRWLLVHVRDELAAELAPFDGRRRAGHVRRADFDGEGDDPQVHAGLAGELRPPDAQRGAQMDGQGRTDRAQAEGVGRADPHADIRLVVERLPRHEEVGVGLEPRREIARLVDGAQPAAAHDAGGGQREIALALDGDALRRHLPVEADARHLRIMRGHLEPGMVAAERDDEVTRMILERGVGRREPDEEREPSGQLAAGVEQVRIRGQNGLDGKNAVVRGEAYLEGQFHEHERFRQAARAVDLRRLLHAGDAEQRQFEPGAELDGDQREGVHQLERGELDAGGKPVLPLHGRKMVSAQLVQHARRTAGSGAEDHADQGEIPDIFDIRNGQATIVAETGGHALDDEGGRAADDAHVGAEDEERRIALLGGRVGADGGDGEHLGTDPRHARISPIGGLQEGAADPHRAGLEIDLQPVEPDLEVLGLQCGQLAGLDADPEAGETDLQPHQLDAGVEQKAELAFVPFPADAPDLQRAEGFLNLEPFARPRVFRAMTPPAPAAGGGRCRRRSLPRRTGRRTRCRRRTPVFPACRRRTAEIPRYRRWRSRCRCG